MPATRVIVFSPGDVDESGPYFQVIESDSFQSILNEILGRPVEAFCLDIEVDGPKNSALTAYYNGDGKYYEAAENNRATTYLKQIEQLADDDWVAGNMILAFEDSETGQIFDIKKIVDQLKIEPLFELYQHDPELNRVLFEDGINCYRAEDTLEIIHGIED